MPYSINALTGQWDFRKSGSSSGSTPWAEIAEATLAASASAVIFSTPAANCHGGKLHLASFNNTEEKAKSLDMLFEKVGTDVNDQVSRVGALGISITASINAGNIEVTLTNNEAFDVSYHGYRLLF